MDKQFQTFLFIFIAILFVLIIYFLKNKRLSLKYSLLWLGSLSILVLLTIFPKLSLWLCKITGIKSPSNLIFSLSLIFLLLISISLTVIVSKMKDQIYTLVQYSARLEKRIRALEEDNKNE